MEYNLPEKLSVGNAVYKIRCDFRDALTAFEAINDADLSETEKAIAVLFVIYPDFENMPSEQWQDALKAAMAFLNCGKESKAAGTGPKLMDWEQDFPYIIAAVNKVCGRDVRAEKHFHWWSFMAAYNEIGDCLFAQIVRIRDKKAKGKKLDKEEQEWYKHNRDIVDLKPRRSREEQEWIDNALSEWV